MSISPVRVLGVQSCDRNWQLRYHIRSRRCLPQQRRQQPERCHINMGNGARPAPAAGCPINHPGRDLKPTIAGSARQAAAANLSATLVDYLMNMDYASGPSMPRISKLALLGPVGLPSSRCTTLADHTLLWARTHQNL